MLDGGLHPAIPADLAAEILRSHEDLSSLSRQFLDYVRANPQCARGLDPEAGELPEWVKEYPSPVQSWPTFLGREKLAQIRRATEGISRIVKTIPERVFDNDPRRFAKFYGIGDESLAALLMEEPNGVDGALVRCDFVDDGRSLKCLEVNMGGNIGGWQLRFWEGLQRSCGPIRRFLERRGVAPTYRDPLRASLHHVAEHTLRGKVPRGDSLNVAIVLREMPASGAILAHLNEVYSSVLEEVEPGLRGEVVLSRYPSGLAAAAGGLAHGKTPVHAVFEYTDQVTPGEVFRVFKAGRVNLYNGPTGELLGDKRNLALLSQLSDSDRFDPEERHLIAEHLPWTRMVKPEKTSYGGETVDLVALLLRSRERFVLKPGVGAHGEEVRVGRRTAPEEWGRVVDRAVHHGGWVVQAWVESRPYLYQHGEEGCLPHDVVWGTFCFGDAYGGAFLRMVPKGSGDGVINSARGAAVGLPFEV